MIGPVLWLEMLLGSRRGRQHVFRWIYAGWLIVQIFYFYVSYLTTRRLDRNASFGGPFVETFVVQQLILILLATPAFVAGAVTDEKTTGTLQYLLAADLTSWEVIAGKLLGRVAQVLVLMLAGLPVLCFIGVLGGMDLVLFLTIEAVSLIALLATAACSLLASVWSKTTRDAVLGLYTAGGAAFLVFRLLVEWDGSAAQAVLKHFDPLYVMEPAWGRANLGDLTGRLFVSALGWGSIAAVCLGLAVWRMRPAYVRQLEGTGQKKKRAAPWLGRRAPVSNEPIRWKERQIEGLAPAAFLRGIPAWFGITIVFCLSLFASCAIIAGHLPPGVGLTDLVRMAWNGDGQRILATIDDIAPAGYAFLSQSMVAMLLASLVVGIRCSGAVSGEREKQTWEALLLSPLDTRQLIRGKLWGIMGAGMRYLIAYAVPALALSLLGGLACFIVTAVSLGLTVLAMYYVGAAGIWCSVRSKTSWRALLGTLGFAYVGGFFVFALLSPFIYVLGIIIIMCMAIVDSALGLGLMSSGGAFGFFGYFLQGFVAGSFIAAAVLFYVVARFLFIAGAEKRVSEMERTRHWHNEPVRRRRRRAPRPAATPPY